jgi:hypothetical protein
MSRLSSIRTGLAVLAIVGVANAAAAQTPAVMDPRVVEFDPSPDHNATLAGQAVVTRYDLEFYLVGGAQPVRITNLGKPSPQSDGKIRVDFTSLLNPWPAAGTTYEARVAATGPNGVGRSSGSNTFAFTSPCSSSISPGNVSVGNGASSGNVTVTAVGGCPWTATSGAAWLSITNGASGNGNGTVSYSVAANGTTSARSGTLSIAGQTFTVNQAAGCTYTITPTATNVASGASTGSVAVGAGASCAWSASSSASWLSITAGANGSGPGTVSYSIAANTGTSSRTGTATIAGRTFSVTQDGVPCSYTLNPVSATLGAAAGSGTVGVTAQSGCAWTAAATSGAGWITVTSGATGSGNGQVGFSVTANSTTQSRSGALTIGGRPFNITQNGQSCSYSISPASSSITAAAATGNFNITAQTGCAWTAAASAPWITVTSGANGSGNGAVGFSVAANPNVTSRSGNISVSGQTYTINQAGVVCTATLSPLSASVGAGGSTGNSVGVTIPSACQWTASSGAQWLTITNGTGGTGGGSVVYNVAANTSTSLRTGSLSIAGQTFNVSQSGLTCSFTVTPTVASAPNTAGTGSVTVTAAAGCNWPVSSSAAWLTFTGTGGSGNGTVNYSFTANSTTQTRLGVLTVAGQPVNITQAAGCGYSINPGSASVGAAAGNGTISVTAGTSCNWNATSPVGWITFSTPVSGLGNGSVGFNVAANSNSSSRSATLTVAGQSFVVTQAGAACDATLNPASQNFAVAGGNGSTSVAVANGCTWSAVPSAGWITVLTGANGTGNGNVTYSVSPNPNGTSRSGTIAIGGKLLNVTQDAAACNSTLSSTSESFESAGGSRAVSVTVPSGCSWTGVSNSAWITVTAGAGPNTSGNGAVTFQVPANTTTSARTGSLTIAGRTVNVTQAGTCDVTLAPTGVSAGAAASSGLVGVATGASCAWTATSSAAWLTVTSGGNGNGNGTVGYSITANTGTSSRTASLTIGGRQFGVTQAAPGCSVSLSPTSIALTPGIAFRGITVTAGAGCQWTTTNTASWITITSGASGTSNGSVFFNVAANNTNAERTATLTIGGQQATVTQAGQGCAVTLSPVSVTVPAAGSSGPVTVAGSIACAWTATSGAPWISITSGGSGTGNGTIQYSVAPNTTTAERTGVINVAGRTFTVTQAATVAQQQCDATLSSNGMSIPSPALNISVGVTVQQGCPWTANSEAGWISVAAPAGGQGSGNVGLSIAQNPGNSSRVGRATVAGKMFQVTQAGACQYSVTPTTVSLGSAAGTAGVSVSAGVGCEWTAQSSVPWITLNSSSGTGGGTVGLNVSANTGSSSRSATLTIAGTQVTVNQQAGAACTVTTRPTSVSPHFKGSDESIAITAGAGCTWTASASVSWITFPRGSSGNGGGTLMIRAAPNSTGEARVGMVIVGGGTVTVTQRSGKAPKPPVGVTVQEAQKDKQ